MQIKGIFKDDTQWTMDDECVFRLIWQSAASHVNRMLRFDDAGARMLKSY